MSLKDQLLEDMKQAMRDKATLELDAIRMLRAKIKNTEINQGPLNDDQVETLVTQTIKQWQDAIGDYKKGDRADLVQEAEGKIKILEKYLPEQLSDEALLELIQEAKQEMDNPQVGPIIGKVKQKVGNQADGSRIAKLAQQAMA